MAEASKVNLVVITRTCKFWGDQDIENIMNLLLTLNTVESCSLSEKDFSKQTPSTLLDQFFHHLLHLLHYKSIGKSLEYILRNFE